MTETTIQASHALLEALGVERPVHLAGWSTGGPAIAAVALDREVASLTFIDPVSPYGYGGSRADGTPCFPDWAGTGGGASAPEFVERLAAGDRSGDGAASPRHVLTTAYWSPDHQEDPERMEMLLTEVLKSVTGDDASPWETGTLGQAGAIPGWPGDEVFPPQPMVSQIRAVLERYGDAGGGVEIEPFEGSGHFPPINAAERWRATFFGFLDSVS